MTKPGRGRLHFIDAARSLAVAFAMFAHAMITFGAWDREFVSPVRYLAQAAPPLFIMMFGMMLEVVYAPRLERGETGPVARRFALRSLQCYLGYAATALAALAAGQLSVSGAGRALLLQRPVPLSTILIFYCFALLAAVPLLLLRRRFGARGLVVLLGVVWAVRPLLAMLGGGGRGAW